MIWFIPIHFWKRRNGTLHLAMTEQAEACSDFSGTSVSQIEEFSSKAGLTKFYILRA